MRRANGKSHKKRTRTPQRRTRARARLRASAPPAPDALAADASRSWLEDFFEHAPFGLLQLDKNGIVERVNLAACALLDRQRSDVHRHPLLMLGTPGNRAATLDHLHALRHTDGIVSMLFEFKMPDGSARPMRLQSRQVKRNGMPAFWTVLSDPPEEELLSRVRRDIENATARANRHEQDAANARQAKQQLLAVISHELRTPLTPAMFAMDRLRELKALPPQATALVDVIKRNLEIEANLITDLLDVTRLGHGRLEIRRRSVDVHDVLLEALQVCQHAADQRKTTITPQLEARSHHVWGDRERLRQVFWNLAINGVKYAAGGRLVVSTANEPSGRLLVTFDDTGIGMDSERIAKLFVPFESGAHSVREGGLGLGLTIAKGIVDAHEGRIHAASDGVGEGSRFTIELPTMPEAAAPRAPAPVALQPRRPCRILLVEDDLDTAEMLSLLLRSDGHEVRVAHTLREAVAEATGDWDVILSDLRLPDGSGLELARHVRKLHHGPKLIALTGYGTPEDVKACWQAGFHQHLVKPIDFDELRRLLPRD